MSKPSTVTVDTQDGPVVVKRLALGDYADLLRSLKQLPASVGQLFGQGDAGLDFNDYQKFLPELLTAAADSWGELAALIAVATDKDADFLLKLDLADVIDITVGVFQVNDFQRIVASIKKLTAKTQPAAAPAAADTAASEPTPPTQ